MPQKKKFIWIGHSVFLGLSLLWLIAAFAGGISFGWFGRFSDVTPAEFVVQVSALLFPVAFLYLLGAYIDRNKMIDIQVKAIKTYLEELVYPSDMGARHMSELNADLKSQIKQFKGCYEDVFNQEKEVKETLTHWIEDLNAILTHMGEQTQKMADYVHQLAEVSTQARDSSADAGQNLAAQADILMNVTEKVQQHLSDTSKNLKTQTEEITQNVHAVSQAEESIEKSLNNSSQWVKELSENAHHIEKAMKTTDVMKTFLSDTDKVLLKCKEIGTTLDLRIKTLKKNPTETESIVVAQETGVSAKEFTEKMQHLLDKLQGLSVEMISIFDLKDEEIFWEKYYAGDKAIFMRHIQAILSQPKYHKAIKSIMEDTSFVQKSRDYMKCFEELTQGLENSPWLGVLVGSDPGRLYMVLANLFEGDKYAHKAS